MKFRDYAANETSLLISRLLAKRAKKSSDDLQAFFEDPRKDSETWRYLMRRP